MAKCKYYDFRPLPGSIRTIIYVLDIKRLECLAAKPIWHTAVRSRFFSVDAHAAPNRFNQLGGIVADSILEYGYDFFNVGNISRYVSLD